MIQRNAYCSFCGTPFATHQAWPRLCRNCGNTSYRNPLPVSVVLLPCDNGLIVVRRAIEPHKGELALPGGFVNYGESWQQAGAREVCEETGIQIDPDQIRLFDVLSAPDSTLLVFGVAQAVPIDVFEHFQPTAEVHEIFRLTTPIELAFPLHTKMLFTYFTQSS